MGKEGVRVGAVGQGLRGGFTPGRGSLRDGPRPAMDRRLPAASGGGQTSHQLPTIFPLKVLPMPADN
jgi:hypothetical protein